MIDALDQKMQASATNIAFFETKMTRSKIERLETTVGETDPRAELKEKKRMLMDGGKMLADEACLLAVSGLRLTRTAVRQIARRSSGWRGAKGPNSRSLSLAMSSQESPDAIPAVARTQTQISDVEGRIAGVQAQIIEVAASIKAVQGQITDIGSRIDTTEGLLMGQINTPEDSENIC